MTSSVFSPFTLPCGAQLPNRLAKAAMEENMSDEGQALCFLSGASSIFAGDKLLTTPNPDIDKDMQLFNILGLHPKAPFLDGTKPKTKENNR